MKLKGIFENQLFRLSIFGVIGIFAITLVINVFVLGGIDFVSGMNTFLPPINALIATLIFFYAWLSTRYAGILKDILGLLVLGLLGWTVAESIWLYANLIQGIELPYPSSADILWLVGYIPLYMALYFQFQAVRSKISQNQRNGIILFSLIFGAVVGYLVLWPIIVDFDSQTVVVSILNLLYPLMDVILFVLTLLISFSLVEGKFSSFWKIITAGFIMFSLSDLLFSYAVWNETYWPDGAINSVTIAIDVFYLISYLVLAFGAFTYILIKGMGQSLSLKIESNILTMTGILLIVTADRSVYSYSNNFLFLVKSKDKVKYEKLQLADALGITADTAEQIFKRITSDKMISNYPLTITDSEGHPQRVWLSALAHDPTQREFSGANIVLQANLDTPLGVEPSNREMDGMLNLVLEKTGMLMRQDTQMVRCIFPGKNKTVLCSGKAI